MHVTSIVSFESICLCVTFDMFERGFEHLTGASEEVVSGESDIQPSVGIKISDDAVIVSAGFNISFGEGRASRSRCIAQVHGVTPKSVTMYLVL